MTDNRATEFIDEPDTIRNEAVDSGLLTTDNQTTADAIAELRKVVREAFSGESVSMLVEGYAIMRAIDAVEAATLGSGTLTAEQVSQAVKGHGNIMDNRLYEDWQAVADELNTTLRGKVVKR